MKKTGKNNNAVKIAVVGASIAALAGAAYFFLGPKGKQHQKQAKSWAIKMKGDVVEKLEQAKEISETNYQEIIDSIAARYTKEKRAGSAEIKALANDLKRHWNVIGKRAKAVRRDAIKNAKKVVGSTKSKR